MANLEKQLQKLYERIVGRKNSTNAVGKKYPPYPQKLASERIRYHMKHLERHPGGRKQAIAIGISEARATAAQRKRRLHLQPRYEERPAALGLHHLELSRQDPGGPWRKVSSRCFAVGHGCKVRYENPRGENIELSVSHRVHDKLPTHAATVGQIKKSWLKSL